MTKRTKEKPTPFATFDMLGEQAEDKLNHLSGLLHAFHGAAIHEDGLNMPDEAISHVIRLALELSDEAVELLGQLREHCSPHLGGVTDAELKARKQLTPI